MSGLPWRFEGYVTEAGARVVENWFWREANEDERNALRLRVAYLANLKKSAWQMPPFAWFGEYGEIRKPVPRGALRVYGFFDEDRGVFVFLHGTVKKVNKDRQGMECAEQRLKRLRRGRGSTHEFDFENEPAQKNPDGEEGESAISRVEPGGGDRNADSSNQRPAKDESDGTG
jgi:hypothetical protein